MSPVYLNPQHSSSIPFLELKGDQHHSHPIIGYLHDHVASINNNTYFSSSNPENHHISTQYLAMDYPRHTHEKVVGKLILSNNISGCNNVNSFNKGDLKPKKCKPTKLRILHAAATVTATDKTKKIIRERDHHHHVGQTHERLHTNKNNNGLMRMCTDCHTTTTPLWRSGPHGPKSLCNACGIRQRKARRAAMAAAASAKLAMDEATTSSMSSSTTCVEAPKLIVEEMSSQLKLEHDKSLTLPLKKRSKTLHNSSWGSINNNNIIINNNNNINNNYNYNSSQRALPRDEEEGAILLMALSCG